MPINTSGGAMLEEAPGVVGTESVLTFPEETEGRGPWRPSPAPRSWFPLAPPGPSISGNREPAQFEPHHQLHHQPGPRAHTPSGAECCRHRPPAAQAARSPRPTDGNVF